MSVLLAKDKSRQLHESEEFDYTINLKKRNNPLNEKCLNEFFFKEIK